MKTLKTILTVVFAVWSIMASYSADASSSADKANEKLFKTIIKSLKKNCPNDVNKNVITKEADEKIFAACPINCDSDKIRGDLTTALATNENLKLPSGSYRLTHAVDEIVPVVMQRNAVISGNCAPSIAEQKENVIAQSISKSLPEEKKQDTNTVEKLTKDLVPICDDNTNRDSLDSNLFHEIIANTDFQALQLNNTQLVSLADGVAEDAAAFNQKSLLSTNPVASLSYMAFISIGAEFNNPYQISSLPTGENYLTNSNNRTAGYVQFDYINRFVTRDPQKVLDSKDEWDWGTCEWMGGNFVKPWKAWPDVQGQIGFLFDNGGTTVSNYSASTLVGSGDFYVQASAGFPFWRMISTDLSLRQQTFFDFSGGFTADDKFYRLHPNMFFGVGYEAAFVPGFGSYSTNTPGFFMSKVGAAWADTPKFMNSSGSDISTNLNDGMPEFDWAVHPAVQVYLAWPLTKSIFLTVEGNAYFQVNSRQEASWNVKVGASVPLEKITTIFSSFISN